MTTHDEAVEAVEAKFHSQVWRAIMPRSRPGVAYDVAYPRVLDHMLVIQNRSALRDWWHSVLRDYGKHKCYGLFLVLPGDVKAIRYLARSGEELELISRNDCAILVMSDVTCASRPPRISEDTWAIAIDEYITHGYSLRVNRIFDINYTEFPCFVLFNDIRQRDFMKIDLRELEAREITKVMREVFAAISTSDEPISAIERLQKDKRIQSLRENIIGRIRSIAGASFETAIKALVEASLHP